VRWFALAVIAGVALAYACFGTVAEETGCYSYIHGHYTTPETTGFVRFDARVQVGTSCFMGVHVRSLVRATITQTPVATLPVDAGPLKSSKH
jgi:hypothetical protein